MKARSQIKKNPAEIQGEIQAEIQPESLRSQPKPKAKEPSRSQPWRTQSAPVAPSAGHLHSSKVSLAHAGPCLGAPLHRGGPVRDPEGERKRSYKTMSGKKSRRFLGIKEVHSPPKEDSRCELSSLCIRMTGRSIEGASQGSPEVRNWDS